MLTLSKKAPTSHDVTVQYRWQDWTLTDIPHQALEATHQQYLRPATLIAANDQVSIFIVTLPIFPNYSIDMEVLYGSADRQNFATAAPKLKARHSRKYFGKDRGVAAFTFLANYVAL